MGSIWDRMENQMIYPATNRELQDAVDTVLSNTHALTHWQRTQFIQALDAFPRATVEDYQRRINQAINEKNQIESDRDELQATIQHQHERIQQAVERWRAEKPEERKLIHPDLIFLLDWLLDEIEYLEEGDTFNVEVCGLCGCLVDSEYLDVHEGKCKDQI